MGRSYEKKVKKNHFNDILLPVILVLCVMPFVVYLAEYNFGYSKYLWHSDNSVMQDLYTYYRSLFFLAVLFFTVVILVFRFLLYREHIKEAKVFLPLLGYGLFAILSTIFSVNPGASLRGNYVEFEGVFVLLGYGLAGYYTYQVLERECDYKTIDRAIGIMFIPMSIIGWFQVFKHDLLNYQWVQKLVMSDALFAKYGGTVEDVFTGNNVFLSLDNPNYAAVFLLMFACVFAVKTLNAAGKKERIISALFLVDDLILCWFTYTRAALVSLAAVFVVFLFCQSGNLGKKKLAAVMGGIAALAALFLVVDMTVMEGRFVSRFFDEKKSDRLESILTTQDGVVITYEGKTYRLTMEEDVKLYDEAGNEVAAEQTEKEDYQMPFGQDSYACILEKEGTPQLFLFIENYTLRFQKEDGRYYFYTEWGKLDSMTAIEKADFGGLEYMGSGRVYIWSRVLPMLKHYLLVGSGPDTFAEVYPQNDYVGKMIYAEQTGRIMERAHNDFFMRWVQTGLVSVIFLILFYVILLKRCFAWYRGRRLDTAREKLGFGCFLGCVGYLISCFFSDSTLYTTPVFYIFAGIALAAREEKQ